MSMESLANRLDHCLMERAALMEERHESAFRLFNGFTEGCPELVLDLYGSTVVINNYADPVEKGFGLVQEAREFLCSRLKWLRAAILKSRNSPSPIDKRGTLLWGSDPDRKIKEHGVWYALDLTLNRDASFYLDTRNLRRWAMEHLNGKTVLNTFAYTGSLGTAALAGGAQRVVQLDRTRRFLDLAAASYALNGFPAVQQDFLSGDFWVQTGRMRKTGTRFDCVFLDPPIFATSARGTLDQERSSLQMINKVRPLVQDAGLLVVINNAIYLSGRAYMEVLESMCADGYLKIQELIPVPANVAGYPGTIVGAAITDPRPFNHSTKIAVLQVRRKRT